MGQSTAGMSVAEMFQLLPDQLDREAAAGVTTTLCWQLTGEQSGVWGVRILDGQGEVAVGAPEDPDVTFTTTDETWVAIAEGRLDPMKAFMTGQLAVEGDLLMATRVTEFFPPADS